ANPHFREREDGAVDVERRRFARTGNFIGAGCAQRERRGQGEEDAGNSRKPCERAGCTKELAALRRAFRHSIQWAMANMAAIDATVYASPANHSIPAEACGE